MTTSVERPSVVLPSLAAIWCCTGATEVSAQKPSDPEPFELYVADRYAYDDNLFRVSNGFAISADSDPARMTGRSKADSINYASVGLRAGTLSSRQAFGLDLRLDDVRFEKNDELDYTGGAGKFGWDWRLGRRWSGRLGAQYERALVNFSNYRLFVKDILETPSYGLEMRYKVGSRWHLLATGADVRTEHSAIERRNEDAHSQTARTGIEYQSPSSNLFGLEYRLTRAKFSTLEDTLNSPGSGFDERVPALRLNYALTGKTQVAAQLGYLQRDYLDPALNDYSGAIGNVWLQWSPRAKTALELKLWHEIKAYTDAESEYFVADGGSIGPVWTPTPRLKFSLLLSLEDQDYQAAGAFTSALDAARRDRAQSHKLTIDYAPRERFAFQLSYRRLDVESNRELRSYEDNLFSAQIKVAVGLWRPASVRPGS